jgi:hypothetical protein
MSDQPFTHLPLEQHSAHFAPVQFSFVQCVQSLCLLFFLLPPANAKAPVNSVAVTANKNILFISDELKF